jgi:7-cyano-7-deazaguanine synthase in queuosine biosynthesis
MSDKKRVLILWSGGIDSTSILKFYLEKTDFEIVALKIKYITTSKSKNRILKECEAIEKLNPFLQLIRPFQFETMLIEVPTIMAGVDVLQFGNLAIYPCNSFNCEEIVISFTTDAHNEKYSDYQVSKLNKIAEILYNGNNNIWNKQPKFIVHPFLNTKKIYIENLGELIKYTWFCRRAKTADIYNGCGECHSCLHVKKSIHQIIEIH